MKKFRSFPIYSVGLAALSVLGTAQISQAATISGGSFMNPLENTEISQTGTLNKFDSTLGDLTKVDFNFDAFSAGSIELTNNSAQNQTVRGTTTVDVFLTSEGITLDTLQVTFDTGFLTLTPGETILVDNLSGSDTGAFSSSTQSVLDLFQMNGGGTFDVACNSLTGIGITGGGGQVGSNQTTQAGCGADVTFTHDAPKPAVTPEASSLLGLSLIGGLGLLGAKSRKKQA